MTRLRTAALLTCLAAASACTGTHASAARPVGTALASPTASPSAAPPSPRPSPSARPLAQLPRGGRTIFPRYLVVAHYGTAGTGALGVLGEGSPEQAGRRLLAAAAPFSAASGRPVLPAFELIASIAQRSPGPDGSYSTYLSDADVARYLAAARRVKAVLVLDLQPGRADFLTQARHFARFLRQPDVGLALDPEWKLTRTQVPLRQIGATDAASINAVSSYLATLTLRARLPEKLFVVHQFRAFMIPDRERVMARPGLATVIHLDGFGTQRVKREVYAALAVRHGPLHNGLKLFIDEDTRMLSPAEAMAVRPRPELITYQ